MLYRTYRFFKKNIFIIIFIVCFLVVVFTLIGK